MSKAGYGTNATPDARSAKQTPPFGDRPDPVDTEELLSLLSDEYTRDIVRTIDEEALPATEIADRLDVSRATVYRRLNRLEEAGVLEASMTYNPEGNHRQRFQTTLERVTLSFDGGSIAVAGVDRSGN